MRSLLNTPIGRLRLVGMLEGVSLLALLFIAMPVKYLMGNPSLVRSVGMAHGVLFLLFGALTIVVSTERQWSFGKVTWKVLLASVIPFGTFYVDNKILKPMDAGA